MPAVFISYSRRDKAFVQRLHEALTAREYDVWVDWEDIPPSAAWFAEIQAGVRGADGFIYVISPDSVASEVCGRELDHALAQSKRVVPVVCREPDRTPVPDAAAALNWVFLRDSDDFEAGLAALTAALETDLDHVRTHTRLGVEAGRWQERGRDRSLLLRGTDLAAAEAWLIGGAGKRPEATSLQREFVHESRRAAARRQRVMLGAVSIALVVAIVLSAVALVQRSTAIHERNTAQARLLDAEAQAQYDTDRELSVILAARAARALPDSQSTSALREALLRSQVRGTIPLGTGAGGDALWSPDGRRLLLTSPARWSRIYAPGSTRPLVSMPGPAGPGESGWDARGDRVVIGGGRPAVYDASTGRSIRALPPGALRAALTPDGARAVTVGLDASGHVYGVASGRQLAVFHPRALAGSNCFALSPDGRFAAECGRSLNAGNIHQHGYLEVWSTATGRLVRTVVTSSFVDSVAYSPDSRQFVVTTTTSVGAVARASSAAITRAAAAAGTLVYATQGTGPPLRTFPNGATAAIFGPSPKYPTIAYATLSDDTVHVAQLYEKRTLNLVGATGSVRTLAFDPGGTNLLAAGDDGTVRVYSTSQSGGATETLAGHNATVTSAAFGAQDTYVASSSDDGTARLWQGILPIPTVSRGGREGLASSLAFSADGDRVVVTGGAPGAGTGRILSAGTLAPLVRFAAPAGQVFTGARWAHDDTPVVTLSGPSGPHGVTPTEAESYNPRSGAMVAAMRPAAGATFFGFSVSRAGDRGAGVEAAGAVSLWNLADGRRLRVLRGERSAIGEAAFSSDGGLVAVAHYPALPATVGFATHYGPVTIQLWNARDGRLVRTITAATLVSQVGGTAQYAPLSLAFSPDGRLLALGGGERSVQVFTVATGRPATPPLSLAGRAAGDFADTIAFSADGHDLVAGAYSGAYLWRLPDFIALPVFQAVASPNLSVGGGLGIRASISDDGRTLFMTGQNTAEVWSLADHRQLLHAYPIGPGALNPAASQAAIANGGGISLYPCPLCGGLPRLLAAAHVQTIRSLTPAERRQFLATG